MRKRLLTIAILGLGIGVMAVTSGAQTADPKGYMPGTAAAPAPEKEIGYVLNAYPTPTDGIGTDALSASASARRTSLSAKGRANPAT